MNQNIESVKSAYQWINILKEFGDSETLNLNLKIPKAEYELWKGIKAQHGLDEGFLEFVVSRMISQTIFNFMQMSDFAE